MARASSYRFSSWKVAVPQNHK